jgi:hypothetical protein
MRALSMTVALLAAHSLWPAAPKKEKREMSARKASPDRRGRKATKAIRAIRAIRGHRARLSGLWQRSRHRPRARPTK